MRPAAILETALYVTDLDRAKVFYSGVLGLDLLSQVEGRHAFFRCGNAVLLLFNADATELPPALNAKLAVPPHGARGPGHACFRASGEEIDGWKRHLTDNGIAIEADFHWPAFGNSPKGGRSIYFRDPSGNSLEFAEPRIWGFEA